MIEQFVKGMKLLSEPDFRALLNQMVDALNFLLAKAEEQEAKVLEDDQEEEATSALYRVSAFTVVIADSKWYYSLTPQKQAQTTGTVDLTLPMWEDDEDGDVLVGALNESEDRNTPQSTGVLLGNSMDTSLPPFGATTGTLERKILPIKSNTLVGITRWTIDPDGTTRRAWFHEPNISQGPCQ